MPTTLFTPLLASGTSIAVSILGVAFLIFVHELGHYLACRLTKTRVETFSIGFGPRLFGWEQLPDQARRFTVGRRRLDPAEHAMDFRLAAVPLGGYVKMAGENPGEGRSEAPDEFPNRPMWARVFIISAGVIMNVLAAVALYTIAFAGNVTQEPPIVGALDPSGAAWEAGLEPGDRIVSIKGQPVYSFTEMKMETVFLGTDGDADIEVERGPDRFTVQVRPRYNEEQGAVLLGIGAAADLTITQGDKQVHVGPTDVVRVAGIETRGGRAAYDLLQAALAASADGGVEIQVLDDEPVTFSYPLGSDLPPAATPIYKIGVEPYYQAKVSFVRGAAASVLKPGDVLLAAETPQGREPLESTSDYETLPFRAPIEKLRVRRGDQEMELPVALTTPQETFAFMRDIGLDRAITNAVKPIPAGRMSGASARYPSSPTADAGVQSGETILAVDSLPVADFTGIVTAVTGADGAKPMTLRVRSRGGDERDVTVTPVALETIDGIDLQASLEPFQSTGVADALGKGVARTGHEIKNIFRLIGAFFTGGISFTKNVAGPATIVAVSSARVESDFLQFLLFLAYISVSLAVLNILPIPVLDGGHLMFILIEKIKGKPLKEETIGRLQFVGLMLLLLLMFFAFKNDFTNLTGR